VVTGEFDLPGVAPGADAQAELAERRPQRLGAADGPGGSVEGRQQAIAGRVDMTAPVPFDLPAREAVVLGEEFGPAGVAELSQPPGRPDDVGEQDGGEDAVGAWPVPLAGEERFDLVGDRVRVAAVRWVIAPGESYLCCTADLCGYIGRDLRRHSLGLGAV